VVEASLGVPTTVRGSYDGTTAGMFGEVVIAESWDGVGKPRWLGPIRHKRGLLMRLEPMLTLTVKPQWVRYMLDETM
jgi:hypothetical protein